MAIAVVYDADCGVCQASVAWAKERDRRGALQFIGNDAAELPAGVSLEETEHTVVVIDGARKLVRAVRVPGIRQIANVGYDAFARRRHRVSAALGMRACAVPQRNSSESRG
jgi:predicted DCC family thiol-disulfide oxidoreductase YuxK